MTKHNAYPAKTTLNLMIRERRQRDLRVLIPCTLAGLLLVGLFCRYAVVGRLTEAYRAEQSADRAEQSLAQTLEALKAYDAVEAEYNRYFSDALFSKDIPQECMDVLAMMERELMDKAQVSSFNFSGNTLLLRLKMSRFGVTSELLDVLSRVPMVDYVSISTATDDQRTSLTVDETAETGESIVIMTITLREVTEE